MLKRIWDIADWQKRGLAWEDCGRGALGSRHVSWNQQNLQGFPETLGISNQFFSGTNDFPFFGVAAPLKMVFPKKGSFFSQGLLNN